MKDKLFLFISILFCFIGCSTEIDTQSVENVSDSSLQTYSITYVLNGGINSENNPKTYTNKTGTIILESPTCQNKIFDGWYTTSDYSGAKVTEIYSDMGNITLYAKWISLLYNIEYSNLEGIINETELQKAFPENEQTIELIEAKKNGYKFEGWFLSSYLDGNPISKLTSSTIRSGETLHLYAKWSLIDYSVTYIILNGSDDMSSQTSQTASYNIENGVLSIPEKTDYTFDGWYKDSSMTEKIESLTGSYGDITLYGKWIGVLYTVSYEGIENASPTNGKQIQYFLTDDTEVSLPSYEKTGYSLDGFYLDETFNTQIVKLTSNLAAKGETLTLYAKWKPIVYTITYNLPQGAVNSANNPTSYTIETETFILQEAEKEGYTFTRWRIIVGGHGGQQVTKIEKGSVGNIELNGYFTVAYYTIAYNLNGGEFSTSSYPTEYSIYSDSITLETPVRSGYRFSGWYETEDFTDSRVYSIPNGATGNKTFYAKWTPIEYSVRYYNPNYRTGYAPDKVVSFLIISGGITSTDLPTSYTVEDDFIALPALSKDNCKYSYYDDIFVFDGWYKGYSDRGETRCDYTEKIESIGDGMTEDLMLCAKWVNPNVSISVSIQGTDDNNFTLSQIISGDTVTLSTSESFISYRWMLDGSFISGAENSSYTLDTSALSTGNHYVMLIVTDESGTYSSTANILVTR